MPTTTSRCASQRGSVHGIVGENGAGKSTLMSILYGFYPADEGTIRIDGRDVQLGGTHDAIAHGVGMVHQHFMLVDRFTVLENVVLGAEQGVMLSRSLAQARRELQRLADEFGLAVDPDARVRDLPVGVLQRVEILKALFRGARILILDEPTGVLTPQETEALFRVLASLKARGVTVLLITHKLNEIIAVTDRVTVMRAGRVVADRDTAGTSAVELAELMVGRKVQLEAAPLARSRGEVASRSEGPRLARCTRLPAAAGRVAAAARRRDRRRRRRVGQRPERVARGAVGPGGAA